MVAAGIKRFLPDKARVCGNVVTSLADRSQQIWGLWQPPRLLPAGPAELLSVLPHNRRRRLQPDPDAMSLIDIGALGGNASNDIFGSQYRRHPVPQTCAVAFLKARMLTIYRP